MVPGGFGVLALLLASAAPATMGPPTSPISWSKTEDAALKKPQDLDAKSLGIVQRPASVTLVTLQDERPYGGTTGETAWLVRYDRVPVPAPDGGAPVAVTLFVVRQHLTHQILAAYTEAAASWPQCAATTADIRKRAAIAWETFPLPSIALESSVLDVLGHVWKETKSNPAECGQIILRPRGFTRKVIMRDENGDPIPQTRANGWVVEVLGKQIGANSSGDPVCTQVYVYSDGTREFAGGIQL